MFLVVATRCREDAVRNSPSLLVPQLKLSLSSCQIVVAFAENDSPEFRRQSVEYYNVSVAHGQYTLLIYVIFKVVLSILFVGYTRKYDFCSGKQTETFTPKLVGHDLSGNSTNTINVNGTRTRTLISGGTNGALHERK